MSQSAPGAPTPANEPRLPSIAVIGMEGAGKTVLTTTLAKRLSTIDERGIFLNPQGVKTLKYVERNWQILQSAEWPPSTPPGEMFELTWKFQIVGELECDVRLIDAAGQDLRLLFDRDDVTSVENLPDHLQALAQYCRNADILLFLINLGDFLGQSNAARRADNEAAIKSAMDYLSAGGKPRRVCLVLTQWDLYVDLAKQREGWLELAAEAVPYVFADHIKTREIAVHPVAAVAQTEVVVDDEGNPRRVPTKRFRSSGLDKLVEWLSAQVREVKHEIEHRYVEEGLQAEQLRATVVERTRRRRHPLRGLLVGAGVAFGIVLLGGGPVEKHQVPYQVPTKGWIFGSTRTEYRTEFSLAEGTLAIALTVGCGAGWAAGRSEDDQPFAEEGS